MSGKRVMDDKIYCETIAKSISDIIRFSLNDEFRKRCCELFGVFSTAQTEIEVTKRLMSIIQNNDTRTKKRGRKLNKKKDKEDMEDRNDTTDEETTDQTSNSTECESQTPTENTLQRNWLQISSQQYRAVIKRKKLQFCSQPSYVQSDQKVGEFFGCSSHFSNSQPTCGSSMNEMLTDTLEVPDDGVSFCKKKFKESFEENAQKYFKKNLKCKGF